MDLPLIINDGEIEIALGKNRKELNWKNKTMLWSEFVAKVANTTRTAETYNEYLASKKERQDEIKDVGGFVGGSLAGGRRKHDSVLMYIIERSGKKVKEGQHEITRDKALYHGIFIKASNTNNKFIVGKKNRNKLFLK